MKRALLISFLPFASIASNASELPKISIGGSVNLQYGVVQQGETFRYELGQENTGKSIAQNGIVNNATEIEFNVDGKLHSSYGNTNYGGVIVLNADTHLEDDDFTGDKAYVYLQNKGVGRFEVGSGGSVIKTMVVSANSLAAAAGGINGVQQKWINTRNADGTKYGNIFIKWPELAMRCDGITNGNKFTYYTPQYSGFSAGVSYSPDYSARGTVAAFRNVKRDANSDFNNVFDLGVKYEGTFSDVGFKIGLVSQIGHAKKDTTVRNDMAAWELGGRLDYKNFAVATSFADWGKSGTPKERVGGAKYGAKYWTLGGKYHYNGSNFSVTYFNGKRANVFLTQDLAVNAIHEKGFNKNQYLSFGADYSLAPGLMPYAELTTFKHNRYGSSNNNKGHIMIVGTKVYF